MKSKHIFNTLFGSSLIILLGSCRDRNELVSPPPPTVTVQKANVRDVVEYAEFSGYTEAAQDVTLNVRVAGLLEKINFKAAQMVKKGDVLFEIEQGEYLAAAEKAKADLAKAEAEFELAKTKLVRKTNAYKDDAISEVDVLEAKANLAVAAASVKQMEAVLSDANRNLSYTKVTAPISGQINRSLVDVGNLVSPSTNTALTTIVNNSPMYVYFSISEKSVVDVLLETKKSIDGKTKAIKMGIGNEGDFPLSGILDYIDNTVDRETGTVQLRATFENKDNYLKAGLYARVRLVSKEVKGALMIPEYAVGKNQRGSYVLVVNDKNIVEPRIVKLGVVDNGEVQIKEGITAEDRVITVGLLKARPNAPVNPEPAK